MKNQIKSIATIIAVGIVFLTASCKKGDEPTPVPAGTKIVLTPSDATRNLDPNTATPQQWRKDFYMNGRYEFTMRNETVDYYYEFKEDASNPMNYTMKPFGTNSIDNEFIMYRKVTLGHDSLYVVTNGVTESFLNEGQITIKY